MDIFDGTRRTEQLANMRSLDPGIGTSCHPAGLAAGCGYAAAQFRCERATQTELVECAAVTSLTVQARREELPIVENDAGSLSGAVINRLAQ